MKVVVNIKTEKEVKESAQKIAKELGISLSDVVNASLHNFIRMREVRFSDSFRMTKELEDLLTEVEKDIKNKKNISKGFSSFSEVNKHLDTL
ncbi:MAG: hypothetical protein PHH88_02635 [Candidatus Pacebacteria bacterium]|jgi:addiction module RelB/DinJ family antitoxin|nr:hypothetical protein [Candidatus Paceibacterota bacterium]MDD4333973.1 hypothetical protein [Candidatus Paceibacterota bacterium]